VRLRPVGFALAACFAGCASGPQVVRGSNDLGLRIAVAVSANATRPTRLPFEASLSFDLPLAGAVVDSYGPHALVRFDDDTIWLDGTEGWDLRVFDEHHRLLGRGVVMGVGRDRTLLCYFDDATFEGRRGARPGDEVWLEPK